MLRLSRTLVLTLAAAVLASAATTLAGCKKEDPFIPPCGPRDLIRFSPGGDCVCNEAEGYRPVFGLPDNCIADEMLGRRRFWEATFVTPLPAHAVAFDTFLLSVPDSAEMSRKANGGYGILTGFPTLQDRGEHRVDWMYPFHCDPAEFKAREGDIMRNIRSGTEALTILPPDPDMPDGTFVAFRTQFLDLNRDCLAEWGKFEGEVDGDTLRGVVTVLDWDDDAPRIVFDTVAYLDLVAWRLPFPWDPTSTPPRNR